MQIVLKTRRNKRCPSLIQRNEKSQEENYFTFKFVENATQEMLSEQRSAENANLQDYDQRTVNQKDNLFFPFPLFLFFQFWFESIGDRFFKNKYFN